MCFAIGATVDREFVELVSWMNFQNVYAKYTYIGQAFSEKMFYKLCLRSNFLRFNFMRFSHKNFRVHRSQINLFLQQR